MMPRGKRYMPLLAIIIFISFAIRSYSKGDANNKQVYIIHTSKQLQEKISVKSHHLNLLANALGDLKAEQSLVYSYENLNALAVILTPQEKKIVEATEGILSVFESKTTHPHTTRSWDFLGLHEETPGRGLDRGRSVIVGVIDTGIWPESRSFQQANLGAPPRRWKGVCTGIRCTNKIIGARFYNSRGIYSAREERSPRDMEGHGSHVASTAAGARVTGASLYGLANGTARGGAEFARIAAYKVCWDFGCADEDVLAAFNDAIRDGVDVISASMGSDVPHDFFMDAIAIGSFHALKHGILTCTSAGNSGPVLGSVVNTAPWMLSVAASTMDRWFENKLVLGTKNMTFTGRTINTFPTKETFHPVLDINENGGLCNPFSLGAETAGGKIVVCYGNTDGSGPLLAGAHGVIIIDDNASADMPFAYPLPATVLSTLQGGEDLSLIARAGTRDHQNHVAANIHKSRTVIHPSAPKIATFSSRGPNLFAPETLKPDISAPGVGILASWSPKGTVSSYAGDKRSVEYNIVSGTSMACPHVTGAAAYVKSHHMKWSPAAIMSALITTAIPVDDTYHSELELAYGAGQVNPRRALSPGLIYDIHPSDYTHYLCANGYDTIKLRLLTGDNSTCRSLKKGEIKSKEVNYPSMVYYGQDQVPGTVRFRRTVTNVGVAKSRYKAIVKPHRLLKVTVTPSELSFGSLHQRKSFVMTVRSRDLPNNTVVSTSVTWTDGIHRVRSPVVLVDKVV